MPDLRADDKHGMETLSVLQLNGEPVSREAGKPVSRRGEPANR